MIKLPLLSGWTDKWIITDTDGIRYYLERLIIVILLCNIREKWIVWNRIDQYIMSDSKEESVARL